MTTPDTAARFEDLESRLTFQEDTILQLNDALVASQLRVDKLEAMVRILVDRLDERPWDADDTDEPPPHY
ncbi:MAG: SlyX family protein [Gammaproteobacteria bacterium]|nr:SlyX family protein [Gammaproteobacteria bacterium]